MYTTEPKHILIVKGDKPAHCLNSLKKTNLWRITCSNIKSSKEILKKSYIDLLCLEVDKVDGNSLELLKTVKNNKLNTKILTIIPNKKELKELVISYGSDDYLCKPYFCEDLIIRCKKLTNCIPKKHESNYESKFLKYDDKFNIVTYDDDHAYIPLTPNQVILIELLIKHRCLDKKDIAKYLNARLGREYSEDYVSVLIYRTRKTIKMSTGRDLIRNKYGYGYYLL